jgi:hypothetical protein
MGLVAFRTMETSVVYYELCPLAPISAKQPSLYQEEVFKSLLNEVRWYTLGRENSMINKDLRLPVSEALNAITAFLFRRVRWPSSKERDFTGSPIYRGVNNIVYHTLDQEPYVPTGTDTEEHY